MLNSALLSRTIFRTPDIKYLGHMQSFQKNQTLVLKLRQNNFIKRFRRLVVHHHTIYCLPHCGDVFLNSAKSDIPFTTYPTETYVRIYYLLLLSGL